MPTIIINNIVLFWINEKNKNKNNNDLACGKDIPAAETADESVYRTRTRRPSRRLQSEHGVHIIFTTITYYYNYYYYYYYSTTTAAVVAIIVLYTQPLGGL